MAKVEIYTTGTCPFCHLAKELLTAKQINFKEIRVDLDPNTLEEMRKRTQKQTVPQIFINDELIGGYEDLVALDKSGKLAELLKT